MPYNGTEFWNAVVAAAADVYKTALSDCVFWSLLHLSKFEFFFFFAHLYHKWNVLKQQLVAAVSLLLKLKIYGVSCCITGLAVGLGIGAIAEVAKQSLGGKQKGGMYM